MMKVIAVAVAGVLLAGSVQAAESGSDNEKQGLVCYSMGSTSVVQQDTNALPSAQGDMSPNLSVNVTPTFYISSARDFKECRKIASEKGARVIIDPNA